MRVYSDGVPERDYPEGCQLAVHYDVQGNDLDPELEADGKGDAEEARRLSTYKDSRCENLPRT